MEHITHTIAPLYDAACRVLLLGTMPSPKSRESGYPYAHPQNRFWRVLAAVFGSAVPTTGEQRQALLLGNHVALWDVLYSCDIRGASDMSIQNPVPNDLGVILRAAPIQAVFTTGSKAYSLYTKLQLPQTGIPAVRLPSTSPANCAVSFEALCEAYAQILPYTRPANKENG